MATLNPPRITGSVSYPTGLRIFWEEGSGSGIESPWSAGVTGFILSASYRLSTIYTTTINSGSVRTAFIPSSYLTNGESYTFFLQALGDGANTTDSVQTTGSATFSYDTTIPVCPRDSSPTFALREYDDDGDDADYVDEDSAVFVTDAPSWNYLLVDYQYGVHGAEASSTLNLDASEEEDETDYAWEFLGTGYYRGWYQLTLKNLSSGTTYDWEATPYDASHSTASTAITGDFTTDGSSVQLATPSISAYPRASVASGLKYSTLQIRLATTIANATSYEYQIATDSSFTTGLLTRTSSTVTSGYPLSGYFTGLTSGTKYYCRARALSSDSAYSTSEWSPVTNTVVSSILPAPTGLEVTNITDTTSTLNWGAVENATGGYTVKWREVGNSDWNTQNVSS